jgi:signal transduction histidine kinase
MKGEFVSVVSHELRTPLTSIMGALSLLNTNAVGELPSRARGMISIGLQNADRLLRLINDILDVEKIESGKMEYNFAPIGVRQLIEEAVQANKAFLDQFGLSAMIEFDGEDDPMICGDEDRLVQVLTNLISNAAKYSPEHGTIRVGAVCRDGMTRLWVKDEGPGVPENFKDRIFQKFSQADASDTRRKGGTGLGLSIAKAIVEQHRGMVGYESERGRGTTFYFDLPLHTEKIIPEQVPLRA